MNEITMNETQAQRDAERIREHAPQMLEALLLIQKRVAPKPGYSFGVAADIRAIADDAIEYATGAHDPDCYELAGYEVDATGTATGVSA